MPVDIARVGRANREPTANLAWVVPLTVAAAALLVAAKLLAGPLALPVLSIGLLCAGFGLAAALYVSGSRDRQGAWHAAGGLVLLGFAAALLSDGHEALIQLERLQAYASAN
jgi:hypothetical protein